MAEAIDQVIVARCGLVCSNCGAFRRQRCGGCYGERPMYRGCPVRACTCDRALETCAACTEHPDLRACGKLHNWISRIFGFIFRSDRIGNLERIRAIGLDAFRREKQAAGTR